MRRLGKLVPALALCVVVTAAAGCGSSHSATKKTTTTKSLPFITPPSPATDKVSLTAATAVAKAVHEHFPPYCRVPQYEYNIREALGKVPNPGAGASCTVWGQQLQALGFPTTAKRDGYVKGWTAHQCTVANASGNRGLAGLPWALLPNSATQIVTPDAAAAVAAAVGGQFHFESCTPNQPVGNLGSALDNASAVGANLTAAGVNCGTVAPDAANPAYAANTLFDSVSKRLAGVLAACSNQPGVLIGAAQPGLTAAIAGRVMSNLKTELCAQNHANQFVQLGDNEVITTDPALVQKASKALPGSSTSSC